MKTSKHTSSDKLKELFQRIDTRFKYKQDKLQIARCHLFEFISEAYYYMYLDDMTPTQISDIFGVTKESVRAVLKKMNVKLKPKGGYHGKRSKTNITGVYFNSQNGKKYKVCILINKNSNNDKKDKSSKKKKWLGTYDSLFWAAWARRAAEIRYNYSLHSTAQDYINKHWREL